MPSLITAQMGEGRNEGDSRCAISLSFLYCVLTSQSRKSSKCCGTHACAHMQLHIYKRNADIHITYIL